MELLAPAGGPEQLDAALHFGADAVYLAGQRWGMRARATNFTDEELEAAVSKAHSADARVYLTLNTLMYEDDLDPIPPYLHFVDELGVDAVLVGDLGALALVREHAPHAEIHVSTQASVANSAAAMEYVRLGASRIVLAREMNLEQIREMHKKLGNEVQLEAFVHGAMCMAVSGRCLLSASMVGPDRSANCGNCTQPCRWSWKLVEETRPDAPLTLEADEGFSYILSANDLCMIEHLDELADAGVVSAKIEGRNKGAYYVAAVVNAYRHVLDGADPATWAKELSATSHRPYSTGFFFGEPTQNPGLVEYDQDRTLVAVAESSGQQADGSFLTEVICRNKATTGDTVVALRPHEDVESFELGLIEAWDEEASVWMPSPDIRVNMERYRMQTPFALSQGDMLCLPNN